MLSGAAGTTTSKEHEYEIGHPCKPVSLPKPVVPKEHVDLREDVHLNA